MKAIKEIQEKINKIQKKVDETKIQLEKIHPDFHTGKIVLIKKQAVLMGSIAALNWVIDKDSNF